MWKIFHHRRDGLAGEYAKGMQHFGCGEALFQPISGYNMCPPCVGYRDVNGGWNPIAAISWKDEQGKLRNSQSGDNEAKADAFEPLPQPPLVMEQLGIEWRPRTSQGVRQWNVDVQGQTPTGVTPVGADAHIKYKSNTKFGAVLVAAKPVTLTTYNDETLFRSWIANNKARLNTIYGTELARYGLLLVTSTYRTPRASINAWEDKDKEAMVSAKVKASMLGDDGITLNYQDQLTDKDWSHYQENPKTKDGVVVFFDGFEVPAWDWWWEGMKLGVRKDTRAVEKDTKQVMQSGKNVQQTALHNESPQRVMSREELVGQRRRSWNEKPAWDEKPGTVHAFDARPPSQSTRTSLRSASSTREPSPLSMRSPVGSGHATPVLHDIHRRTTSTPLIPMYNEKQHQENRPMMNQRPLTNGTAQNGLGNRLSAASTAAAHHDPKRSSKSYQPTATESTVTSSYLNTRRGSKSRVRDLKNAESRPVAFTDRQEPDSSHSDGRHSYHDPQDTKLLDWTLAQPENQDSLLSESSATPIHQRSLRRKTSSPSLRRPS